MSASPKRRTRGHNEGSIYQRASDGKWVAVVNLGWRDGKRQRKYLYGATRKEAADKLTEALAKQRKGERVAYDRQTVREFLDHWHAEHVVPNRKPNTARAYRNHIDARILPAIGDKRLDTLTPRDVQSMITCMRTQGYSPTTMHDSLAMLRTALKRAERWDLVPRNVAALVDSPTTAPFPCNPLNPDEARRFLAQVADDRLSALYEIAVRLGLRSGELRGLLWSDIDLDAGVLHVRRQLQWIDHAWVLVPPKTERSRRSIDLSPHLIAALAAHQARQADERDLMGHRWQPLHRWSLVFPNSMGRPINPASLREQLHRHLAAAQLAKRRIHDLRHTAVTLMMVAGVPERVIMEIVGHSGIEMTRIYGHILPPSRRDALARVDALLQRDSR